MEDRGQLTSQRVFDLMCLCEYSENENTILLFQFFTIKNQLLIENIHQWSRYENNAFITSDD